MAAQAVLWRRLSATTGMEKVHKPRLEPIRKLLTRKHGAGWGAKEAAALRSLAINSQWPQERLHGHGLAPSADCQLCQAEAGCLVHRGWRCDATHAWRRQHVPSWIEGLDRKPGVLPVFLARAIAPSLDHLVPPPTLLPEIHVYTEVRGGAMTGDVFIDGSGTHPTCSVRCRVGSGAVMVNGAGENIGAIFGPAPLAYQSVPGAEAYALYLVLQMCIPPIRVWSDCAATIDGVRRGELWATDGQRMHAKLWHAIWGILRDIGVSPQGLTIMKTKAHATQADVARGVSTWWEMKCNGMADDLAKRGAKCHPCNEEVLRVWPAYDHQIKLVAAYLARCTARLGGNTGRDCTAQRRRRKSHGQQNRRQRAPHAPTGLQRAWLEAIRAVETTDDQPLRSHRLWEAKVFQASHASSNGDEVCTLTYCSRCGAYATEAPRALVGKCKGSELMGGRTQLARIATKRFPHAGPRTRDWRIGQPQPVTEAALYARLPKTLLNLPHLEAPLAQTVGEGPSLDEAMSAIGLTHAGVEAYHRWQATRRALPGRDEEEQGSDSGSTFAS